MLTSDSVYWAFSAAAQVLAALVGFILAGFALAYSMLESQRTADDTLTEIMDREKKNAHLLLSALIVIAVVAVTVDLLVVYANSADVMAPIWTQLVGLTFSLLSLIYGAFFVVHMVDPERHRRIARRLAFARAGRVSGDMAPATSFFTEFVKIERYLRELYLASGLQDRADLSAERNPSVRRMVGLLRDSGALPVQTAVALQDLVSLRNLVFHGEFEEVTVEQIAGARRAKESLQRLVAKARKRYNTD